MIGEWRANAFGDRTRLAFRPAKPTNRRGPGKNILLTPIPRSLCRQRKSFRNIGKPLRKQWKPLVMSKNRFSIQEKGSAVLGHRSGGLRSLSIIIESAFAVTWRAFRLGRALRWCEGPKSVVGRLLSSQAPSGSTIAVRFFLSCGRASRVRRTLRFPA